MTKRFTLLLLFLTAGIISYAQSSFVFLNEETPVADNSTVYCGELDGRQGMISSPVKIQKTADEPINATLTISVSINSYGGFVGYCGWGFASCLPVQTGSELSSNKLVNNGNAIDPFIEILALSAAEPFFFEIEYKLIYNGKEQKINLVMSSEPVALNAPEAGSAVSVSYLDGQSVLKYDFQSAGERQALIYNIAGVKVAEISLIQNCGSVILPNLPKGIYIYAIRENGKMTAGNRYIAR